MVIAQLNAMQALVERSRETATMTLPDPRLHPRSVQWEAEGGRNLKNYQLTVDDSDAIAVRLPLLRKDAENTLEEYSERFPLAPSGQLQGMTLDKGTARRSRSARCSRNLSRA